MSVRSLWSSERDFKSLKENISVGIKRRLESESFRDCSERKTVRPERSECLERFSVVISEVFMILQRLSRSDMWMNL